MQPILEDILSQFNAVLEQKASIFSLREDYRRETSQPYVQICIQVRSFFTHFISPCASRQ